MRTQHESCQLYTASTHLMTRIGSSMSRRMDLTASPHAQLPMKQPASHMVPCTLTCTSPEPARSSNSTVHTLPSRTQSSCNSCIPVPRAPHPAAQRSQGCTFDDATQQCTGVNANDVQLLSGTQPASATVVQQRILAIILDLTAFGAPPGATEAAVLRVGPGFRQVSQRASGTKPLCGC